MNGFSALLSFSFPFPFLSCVDGWYEYVLVQSESVFLTDFRLGRFID